MLNKDRAKGALFGLAVGDAVGTTLEFKKPGTFAPITDMVGGGPFNLKPGQWTDDTSMALCLAESLITKQDFDAKNQLEIYDAWQSEGYLSSIPGVCFDIGNITVASIYKFVTQGVIFQENQSSSSAGNGSIMRLAPVAIAYAGNKLLALERCAKSSKTTHGLIICIDACILLGHIIVAGINDNSKDEMLKELSYFLGGNVFDSPEIGAIMLGSYKHKQPPEIKGTGYVAASLEAALWSFYTTDSFRDCILAAANLGDDADTTAAIAGQIAGAYYGLSGIPKEWVEKLTMLKIIDKTAEELIKLWEHPNFK